MSAVFFFFFFFTWECLCRSYTGIQGKRRWLAVSRTVRVDGGPELVSCTHRGAGEAHPHMRDWSRHYCLWVKGRTVLHGGSLPGQAAGRTGALSEGHLRQGGCLLTIIPPITFWRGHELWHLQVIIQILNMAFGKTDKFVFKPLKKTVNPN